MQENFKISTRVTVGARLIETSLSGPENLDTPFLMVDFIAVKDQSF